MLTEAIHTPFMQDRFLALENAKYVMNNMADLGGGDRVPAGTASSCSARRPVLEETVAFLEKIDETGLMPAIEQGLFADIKRPRDMGKGLEGLRKKGRRLLEPLRGRTSSGSWDS